MRPGRRRASVAAFWPGTQDDGVFKGSVRVLKEPRQNAADSRLPQQQAATYPVAKVCMKVVTRPMSHGYLKQTQSRRRALPETHHSYPGGMLDQGLEIVVYGLKLRQSRLLPIGAPPENQAAPCVRSGYQAGCTPRLPASTRNLRNVAARLSGFVRSSTARRSISSAFASMSSIA